MPQIIVIRRRRVFPVRSSGQGPDRHRIPCKHRICPVTACAAGTHSIGNAARLIDASKPIFGNDPVFTSEIGPVIGAHVGPGLLGVGGVSPQILFGDSGG